MTVSVAENRERGLTVEDRACQRWPLEPVATEHDARDEWYDLEFVDDVERDLTGTIVDAGALAECKSCYDRYDGRNGRWWVRRRNHERLLDAGGWYILVVVDRDTGSVRRMALASAETVDRIIDGDWWNCGNGGRSAEHARQIPWSTVFDSLEDPHGGVSL